MFTNSAHTFTLDNFEGPLELLLYLVQKKEIDISAVALKKLTEQFMQVIHQTPDVDISSETLSLTATLLLMKSQRLLPQEDLEAENELEDPRFELIQHLIEYCHFKDTAKNLSLREEEQKAHFPRATSAFRKELGAGLEEVDFESLKTLFFEMLKRSAHAPAQLVQEEEWQVSHKLLWLQRLLQREEKIEWTALFAAAKGRMEMIVLFLALLEMMKNQQALVVKENEKFYILCLKSLT